MNYPDNWFCFNCNKQFYEHIQIGTPNEEASVQDILEPATKNWCHKWSEVSERYSISALDFKPVDNLTQIELLNKQRRVKKGNTLAKRRHNKTLKY